MPAIEALVAAIAAGVVPAVLNFLEGRRGFRSRKSEAESEDKLVHDVSQMVAEQAADTVVDVVETVAADRGAPRAGERNEGLPPADQRQQALTAIQSQLNDPEFQKQLRQALGIRTVTKQSRLAQVFVTLGLVVFIVYALVTKTEPSVAFAFMGSIGGFWLREVAA